MPNPNIPPKCVKVLAVLNELGGKSGTSNLLHHYKKSFPDDYMHLKLLIAHLDFLFHAKKIKRFYNSFKGIDRHDNPQTYMINDNGKFSLGKWRLL